VSGRVGVLAARAARIAGDKRLRPSETFRASAVDRILESDIRRNPEKLVLRTSVGFENPTDALDTGVSVQTGRFENRRFLKTKRFVMGNKETSHELSSNC
jgi:hypothetical protein